MKCIMLIFMVMCLNGCMFTQTVYVPYGQSVMLRETVKNAKVWVKIKGGKTLPSKTDLHEGWYCLPDGGIK